MTRTVYFGCLPWGQIRGRQYEGNICYELQEQSYRLALFPKHLWTVQAPFHIHRSKIAEIIVMYGHLGFIPDGFGPSSSRDGQESGHTLSPSAKNVVKEPSWSSSNDIIFKEKVFFEKKKNWFCQKWKIWKNDKSRIFENRHFWKIEIFVEDDSLWCQMTHQTQWVIIDFSLLFQNWCHWRKQWFLEKSEF